MGIGCLCALTRLSADLLLRPRIFFLFLSRPSYVLSARASEGFELTFSLSPKFDSEAFALVETLLPLLLRQLPPSFSSLYSVRLVS